MWRSVLSLLGDSSSLQASPLPAHYKPARRPLQDLEAAGLPSPSGPVYFDGEDLHDQGIHIGRRRTVSFGGHEAIPGSHHPQAGQAGAQVVVDVAGTPSGPPSGPRPGGDSFTTGTPLWGRGSHGTPATGPSDAITALAAAQAAVCLSDYATCTSDQTADATAELHALAAEAGKQQLLPVAASPAAPAHGQQAHGQQAHVAARRASNHNIPPNGALGGLYGPGLFRNDSYPPAMDPGKAAPAPAQAREAAAPPRGPPAARFEELRFVQQIGEGGFGRVYYGYWQGQRVAIKLAHPATGPDPSNLVREFSREVAAMSALPPHKNVLTLLAACTEPPQLALVTDYCAAGSLYALLHAPRPAGGGPPLPQLLSICHGVAQGMAWLHRHSILHRDLKSANILLDNGGNAKIADFGLAKIYNGHRQAMTGGLGTYQWAAPEVLAHQRYSEKADVYSFGVVLWECLTGRLPYEGMTAVQAAVGVVNHGLRPEIPRGTPPAMADLIRACWAAVPEQRPPFTQIELQVGALLQQARAAAAGAAASSVGSASTSSAGGSGGGGGGSGGGAGASPLRLPVAAAGPVGPLGAGVALVPAGGGIGGAAPMGPLAAGALGAVAGGGGLGPGGPMARAGAAGLW